MMTALLPGVAAPAAPPRRPPFSFVKRQGLLFLCLEKQYWLACRSQVELVAVAEAQRFIGRRLPLKVLGEDALNQALATFCQHDSSATVQLAEDLDGSLNLAALAGQVPEIEDPMEQENDAPIIRLISATPDEAIRESASGVHLETFEKRLVVRFRVDGVLREVLEPKRELAVLLVSRIKVMTRLDIAEKRIPQDGRISLRVGGREVDTRVSTLPSTNDERVVLRLFDKQAGRLNLQYPDMSEHDRKLMDEAVHKPHGILLVTGPTSSGKTTILYTNLTTLGDRTWGILIVEGPIEYRLEGIGQTQVNAKVDIAFARSLWAILRQDPDVVMTNKIHDRETAEIAVQASLTGHLVLSTLHANSAVGAITRLVDMGIESFLLSFSMLGVLTQHLVRVLCPACKEPYHAGEAECALLGVDPAAPPTLHRACGCGKCRQHSCHGRIGIYELMMLGDHMHSLIHNESPEQEMTRYTRTNGPSIRDDGRHKVLEGVTTVEGVLRVTREE